MADQAVQDDLRWMHALGVLLEEADSNIPPGGASFKALI